MTHHFVHPTGPGRLAVVYLIPGTNIASVVVDGVAAARASLQLVAEKLTQKPAPYVPPEERPIVKGFYGAEQLDLL